MDVVPGSVGTSASFSLRLGQTIFSSASLLFMSLGVEFYTYTAFCYLVTIMGLTIPWSFTLAIVDGYSVLVKCPVRQPGILLIIVLGDWVLSTLTLAAACSTASVVDLLLHSDGSYCPPKFCSRYQISAAMAFLSWFLSMASSLFNLWLLPSLWFFTHISSKMIQAAEGYGLIIFTASIKYILSILKCHFLVVHIHHKWTGDVASTERSHQVDRQTLGCSFFIQ